MTALSDAREWLRRSRHVLSDEERRLLLGPHRVFGKFLRFPLDRALGRAARAPANTVDRRDPELVRWAADAVRVAGRHYFRVQVEGVATVPAGPVLFVGNHSGGLLPLEGLFTVQSLLDHFGPERRVFAMAHDLLFHDPVMRGLAQRLGILRASPESAMNALASGASVLVYPGSDFDAFRPYSARHRIQLAGRTGFLRLALAAGVPIVPVVTAGTHEQLIVLTPGTRLASWLHTPKILRTAVLPLVISVPWGLSPGFLPYVPLPAQTSIAFLPAMRWPDLDAASASDPVALARCYRDVETAMQTRLDELGSGRRFLLGKRSR